jgi:Double zinc ribbon
VIVCRSCGHQNDDTAKFCLSCRTYLWDKEPAPVAPEPAPELVGSGAGPAAQQPAPPREAPPIEVPAPRPPVSAGAVHCGVCHADNEAGRQLCGTCGASLTQLVPKPLPWWRRLFRRRSGPPAVAGDRPGQGRRHRRHRTRKVLRSGVVVTLIAVVAMLAGPWRGLVMRGYHNVKDRVTTTYDPVKAVAATATSAARGHQPALVIDGVKDTAWAEGARDLGLNQKLTIQFDRKVELAQVGITPGASSKEKQFLAQPRPREILLLFAGGEQTVTLKDAAEFQAFDLPTPGVDRVRLEILSVYSGQSGKDTSIAEVEFFTKR